MKPKSIRDSIIALVAIIVALAAAYWLDQASFLLRQRASQTFYFQPALWLPALGQLADSAAVVCLVWWLATRADLPRAIDIVYALAGFAAALSIPLDFTTPTKFFSWVVGHSGGRLACWTMTGAVLAMAGLFHLLRRRPTIRSRTVSAADPP